MGDAQFVRAIESLMDAPLVPCNIVKSSSNQGSENVQTIRSFVARPVHCEVRNALRAQIASERGKQ